MHQLCKVYLYSLLWILLGIHVFNYTHMHKHTHIPTNRHAHTHTNTPTDTNTHIETHKHTHAHTNISMSCHVRQWLPMVTQIPEADGAISAAGDSKVWVGRVTLYTV